ncbi:hypothetical protein U1Q18_021854 [Sarracenia purpurea var. burkii]
METFLRGLEKPWKPRRRSERGATLPDFPRFADLLNQSNNEEEKFKMELATKKEKPKVGVGSQDLCGFSMISFFSVTTSFMEGRRQIEGFTTEDEVRSNSSLLGVVVAIDGAGVTSGALEAARLGLSPSSNLRETMKLFPHWPVLLTLFLSPRTRAMLSGYHEWFQVFMNIVGFFCRFSTSLEDVAGSGVFFSFFSFLPPLLVR